MPSIQPIYRNAFIGFFLVTFTTNILKAQELYPLTEPASTLPKNVLGIRIFSENYRDKPYIRTMQGLRFMYGITKNWTLYTTSIFSNHHGEKFPLEFPFHNTPERGVKYPYKYNGQHFYTKYRLLSIDKKNEHFRIALYGEGTIVKTTHHESEPNLLMGDNSGIGGGTIITYLKNKWAISGTVGYIKSFGNTNITPDPIPALPDIPIRVEYGNAYTFSLSGGYLLFPQEYESYDQTNINLYIELTGKRFGAGSVDMFKGSELEYRLLDSNYPDAFRKGFFIDISPTIQAIIKSNLRIDASLTLPLLGTTYAKQYPLITLGMQYYFYL